MDNKETLSRNKAHSLGGHLLVQCLIEQGVTHVFGVPGESYLAVLDGFHQHQGKIEFITNRQEGGAAFMAEAVGKLTRRPGVCMVTRGPGATNASIGLHNAFQDGTPMVLFVGDVGSDFRDREAFQEVDYNSFFGPNAKGLAKHVERIDDVNRLPEYVSRAFAMAMNGRPGPVVVVLPEDMLTHATTARPLPRVEPVKYGPNVDQLSHVLRMLSDAKRPLMIVGGSGWCPESAKLLEQFAFDWHMPVANAFRFQDVFDNHHELYAGDVGIGINPALAQSIKDADLILALGPRLGEMTTGGYTLLKAPEPLQKLIHAHLNPEELHRVYRADLALASDMKSLMQGLCSLKSPAKCAWQGWTSKLHQDYVQCRIPSPSSDDVDIARLVEIVSQYAPPDTVFTNGAGNFSGWLHRFHPYHGLSRGQKTQLAPTSGAMGYGVPAGIAAAVTQRRTVVTFAGDGDFLMTGQELATATQHGAKTIVILLNNGMYGTIRMHQEREYPGRVSGSNLSNPDFCSLATAYGYEAARVSLTSEFEPAFKAALASRSGFLIEVMQNPASISTRTRLKLS